MHPHIAVLPRPRLLAFRSLLARVALALLASLGVAATPDAPQSTEAAVAVPPGWALIKARGKSFLMGEEFAGHRWTYTSPVHPVAFTYDFLMRATQVTQAEFKKVAGANPTLHPGDENRPIDNVSWFDAVLYCNALSHRDGLAPVYNYTAEKRDAEGRVVELTGLWSNLKSGGYRLLTSAEYEYVTRAGTTTRWFFGDRDEDQPKAIEFAWCELNSNRTPHPVGTLQPNSLGVYDITGNLWMWCHDWYGGAYPTSPQTDPVGPGTGEERIARGGAFKNDVNHQRSAYHWQWTPQSRNFELGFRIARTVPPVPISPLALAEINEEAWYRIVASHSGKTLEIQGGATADGAALQQATASGADRQLFQFRRAQSGYYQIFVKSSGKALQVKDNSLKDHAGIVQASASGADNQLFVLVKDTDDSFSIVAKSSGYGFDISGGATALADGAPVIVYPAGNALNHKFTLLEASLAGVKRPVAPLAHVPAYVPPFDAAAAGMTSLFDGQTLAGWIGDPSAWKVQDGAIVGVKDNQLIATVGDYDDFRLIVSTIQVDSPTNHQGVGFWGERLSSGLFGYGGCVLVMPPMQWSWDYITNSGAHGKLTLARDLDKELGITRSEWTQAEILVNRANGTIRMAINGIEVLFYTDSNPSRLKRGPVGLQAHGGNRDVRYKDIFIEVSPKDHRLITLKN